MNYVISEEQLIRVAIKFLDSYLKDLRVVHPEGTTHDYRQFIGKDGKMKMDGIIGKELLVMEGLYYNLKDMFGLTDSQVRIIFELWTKGKFGLEWGGDIIPDSMNV